MWYRHWGYDLARIHRMPVRSPYIFAILLCITLPLVTGWWFTGTDLYRSEIWIIASYGDRQAVESFAFEPYVISNFQIENPRNRWERFSAWITQTLYRLTASPSPIDLNPKNLPDWTSTNALKLESDTPYGKVIAIEVSDNAWYLAAWSSKPDIAGEIARLYASLLVERFNQFTDTPSPRTSGLTTPSTNLKKDYRTASSNERRAEERLQSCFQLDAFGLPDIATNVVNSSILSSLENEDQTNQSKLAEMEERLGPQNPRIQEQKSLLQAIEKRKRMEILRLIRLREEQVLKSRKERLELESQLLDLNEWTGYESVTPSHDAQWSAMLPATLPWLPDRPLGLVGLTWMLCFTLILTWGMLFLIHRLHRVLRVWEDLHLQPERIAELILHTHHQPPHIRADIDAMVTGVTHPNEPLRWHNILFKIHPPASSQLTSKTWLPSEGGLYLIHGVQAGPAGGAGALAIAQIFGSKIQSVLVVDHRDDDALAALIGENNPWLRNRRGGRAFVHTADTFMPERSPSPTDLPGVWYITAHEAPRRLGRTDPLQNRPDVDFPAQSNLRWKTILRVYSDGHRFEADRLVQGTGCILMALAGVTSRSQWHTCLKRVKELGHENPYAILIHCD